MFKCVTRQDSLAVIDPQKLVTKKKILIIGDGNVGKTCLINRFTQGDYSDDTIPTISQMTVENVQYGDTPIELSLHDTAGQEEYGTFRPKSYPGTDVVILCFSINSLISLENVSLNWLPEVRHFCGSVPIILVGTKSDLRGKCNSTVGPVKFEDGCAMAYRINALTYVECSSKLDKGVEDVFHAAIKASITKQKKKRFF